MSGLDTAIQSAIFSRLDSQLATPVYDNAPQVDDASGGFPYVTIGEDVVNEWDTDTNTGGNVLVTLHTWSRYKGRAETKQIQGAIYSALHRTTTLSATGYHILGCDFVSSESFLDSDGLTRHGVSTYRIYIEEA